MQQKLFAESEASSLTRQATLHPQKVLLHAGQFCVGQSGAEPIGRKVIAELDHVLNVRGANGLLPRALPTHRLIESFIIIPSPTVSNTSVEPSTVVLGFQSAWRKRRRTLLLDIEALYDICFRTLEADDFHLRRHISFPLRSAGCRRACDSLANWKRTVSLRHFPWLHDGLCSSDVSRFLAVPRTDGPRTQRSTCLMPRKWCVLAMPGTAVT